MALMTDLATFKEEMAVVVPEFRQAITTLMTETVALKTEMGALKVEMADWKATVDAIAQILDSRFPRPMGFQQEH